MPFFTKKSIRFAAAVVLVGLAALPSKGLGEEKDPEWTLSAVGDVLLWHWEMGEMLEGFRKTKKPEQIAAYPFEKVRSEFKGITVGNLEGTITNHEYWRFKPRWMKYYFRMPPVETVGSLKHAGFDLMFLANNHIKDTGSRGLKDTMLYLQEAGIKHVGAGMNSAEARKPVVMQSGSESVTFLSYNMIGPKGTNATKRGSGAAKADLESMVADIHRAGEPGTTIVVALHWGQEQEKDLPVVRPQAWQRDMARRLIDEGAALVLGSHSHAVSEVEEYRHGLIAYSLGNFLFAGNRSANHHSTVILQVQLRGPWVKAYRLVPVFMEPPSTRYQPRIMGKKEGFDFLKKVLFNPTRKHLKYQARP